MKCLASCHSPFQFRVKKFLALVVCSLSLFGFSAFAWSQDERLDIAWETLGAQATLEFLDAIDDGGIADERQTELRLQAAEHTWLQHWDSRRAVASNALSLDEQLHVLSLAVELRRELGSQRTGLIRKGALREIADSSFGKDGPKWSARYLSQRLSCLQQLGIPTAKLRGHVSRWVEMQHPEMLKNLSSGELTVLLGDYYLTPIPIPDQDQLVRGKLTDVLAGKLNQSRVIDSDLIVLGGRCLATSPKNQREPLSEQLFGGMLKDPDRLVALDASGIMHLHTALRFGGVSGDQINALVAQWKESCIQNVAKITAADFDAIKQMNLNDDVLAGLAGRVWQEVFMPLAGHDSMAMDAERLELLRVIQPYLVLDAQQYDSLILLIESAYTDELTSARDGSLSPSKVVQLARDLEVRGIRSPWIEQLAARWSSQMSVGDYSTARVDGLERKLSAHSAFLETRQTIVRRWLRDHPDDSLLTTDELHTVHALIFRVIPEEGIERRKIIADAVAQRLINYSGFGGAGLAIHHEEYLPVLVGDLSDEMLGHLRDQYLDWVRADTGQTWIPGTRTGSVYTVKDELAARAHLLKTSSQEMESIDWFLASHNAVDPWYPFGMQEHFQIFMDLHRYWIILHHPYQDAGYTVWNLSTEMADDHVAWLRSRLDQGSLQPRPGFLFFIAWHYRDHYPEKMAEWQSYLDSQIASTEEPFIKIQWLLGRGYVDELDVIDLNADEATPWIRQALAIAPDEATRLELFQALVINQTGEANFLTAESIINGMEPTFEGDDAKDRFARMRELIGLLKTEQVVIDAKFYDAQERLRLEGRLEMLNRKLAKLKSQNPDDPAIATVQAAADALSEQIKAQ